MTTSDDLHPGREPIADVIVVVVGAGPTGLTAALLLARDGVAVQVVDRNSEPVRESRALIVQARVVELWAKLGLADTARAGGTMVRGAHALLDGRELAPGRMTLDLAAFGAGLTPYPEVLILGQDRTERMLLDALADLGVAVERDTEVLDLTDDPDLPHVVVRTRTADGVEQARRARYVIGADGAHSTVRHQIGATFDGAAHEGAFFLADTAVDWDRGYGDALTVALNSRGGLALFVPMPDAGAEPHRFRVFGGLGTDPGATITLTDVQRRLDAGAQIPTRLYDPRWIAVYRLHSRMANVFARGRVFLAGDAAHIHTPVGGQGMNTGIQDAYNLAWKLSAVLRGHARPQLLESYAVERRPVARALLATTDAAFDTIIANGRITRVLRPVVAAVLPTLLRVPAIGRRVFTVISQIGVRYPESPAVGGTPARARAARPGDRAPHADLDLTGNGPARTVFDLLTGTDHHLLMFAAAHPAPERARDAVQRVVDRTPTPIRLHLLRADERAAHRAYDARRPTVLLVRPDGHIAWRGALDDSAGLAGYLDGWYLTGHPGEAS